MIAGTINTPDDVPHPQAVAAFFPLTLQTVGTPRADFNAYIYHTKAAYEAGKNPVMAIPFVVEGADFYNYAAGAAEELGVTPQQLIDALVNQMQIHAIANAPQFAGWTPVV